MSESIDDVLRAAERRASPPRESESVLGSVAPELVDEFPGLVRSP